MADDINTTQLHISVLMLFFLLVSYGAGWISYEDGVIGLLFLIASVLVNTAYHIKTNWKQP